MRVKDPFDEVDVNQRKAVLITACTIVAIVVFALLSPTWAAWALMIFAFFVMIMLHEFGHFVAAKRSGMKVTEFFVGFGPRLWSFRRGETEYGVKAVPAGGYCRIIGMNNLEEIPPEDEPRVYRSKPWHQKVGVAAAGPAVHFLIAGVLIFTVLFFGGDTRHAQATTTLGDTTQGAAAAGLRPGDEVIAINGTAVRSWDQVPDLVNPNQSAKAGDHVRIVVRRGDQVFEKTVELQQSTDAGANRVIAGIGPEYYVPHPGLFAAIADTPRQVGDVSWQSLKALGSMFSPAGITNYFHLLAGDTGKNVNQSQRFLSPVGFGQVSYQAIEAGWVSALWLLIAINIFVGLLNLVPLLPFDGGHIAVASYEKVASAVRGRRVTVDAAKLIPVTMVVLAIFVFIAISSVFLDVTHPISF